MKFCDECSWGECCMEKTAPGKGLQQLSCVLGEGHFRCKSNVNRGLVVGCFGGFFLRFLYFSPKFFLKHCFFFGCCKYRLLLCPCTSDWLEVEVISGLLRKRDALLSQGCGKAKRDGGAVSNGAFPACASQLPWARMSTGIPVRGAFQRHRAGQEFTEELTALGVLFVTDLGSEVWSLKPSVTDPATSVPHGICGGGNAAPLPSPFPMKDSFLPSPGILKSFLVIFMFACLTLCLGTHVTRWEDSR